MSFITVDVVLTLPPAVRDIAVWTSSLLARRMRADGCQPFFELGRQHPRETGAGECEPHVSLFMLRLADDDTAALLRALRTLAAAIAPIPAEGVFFRHNPYGAPELFYRKNEAWTSLQRQVIAGTEPLRSGLRDEDPAGERLKDLVARLSTVDPQDDRLAQLVRYGYDEVTDDRCDRFDPHVTFTWPADSAYRVDWADVPPPDAFSGTLTDLSAYRMSSHGTCVRRIGGFPLSSRSVNDEVNKQLY